MINEMRIYRWTARKHYHSFSRHKQHGFSRRKSISTKKKSQPIVFLCDRKSFRNLAHKSKPMTKCKCWSIDEPRRHRSDYARSQKSMTFLLSIRSLQFPSHEQQAEASLQETAESCRPRTGLAREKQARYFSASSCREFPIRGFAVRCSKKSAETRSVVGEPLVSQTGCAEMDRMSKSTALCLDRAIVVNSRIASECQVTNHAYNFWEIEQLVLTRIGKANRALSLVFKPLAEIWTLRKSRHVSTHFNSNERWLGWRKLRPSQQLSNRWHN